MKNPLNIMITDYKNKSERDNQVDRIQPLEKDLQKKNKGLHRVFEFSVEYESWWTYPV